MKLDTKHLERNWSAWHSAVSQCTHFTVMHGDTCVHEGEAELVRDGKHTTLKFPGPKAKPKAKPRVKSVAKSFQIVGAG